MTDDSASIIQHSEVTTVSEASPAPILDINRQPNGDGVFFVARDGYKMHTLPGARRHQRAHTFDDIGSFATWLIRHAKDRERTEILVEEQSIVAGLEPGALHGDRVVCSLVHDPRFLAWATAFKQPMNQKRFHSLIRAERADLEPQVCSMLLAAIRDFTITRGTKRQIKIDERNFIRYAAESNEQDVAGQLPSEFTVRVPIFEGVGDVLSPLLVSRGSDPVPGVLALEPGPLQPGSVVELVDGMVIQQFTPPAILYPIDVLLSLEEQPNGDLAFGLEAPALPVVLRRARRDAAAYLASLLRADSAPDKPRFLVGLGKFAVESVPAFDTPPGDATSYPLRTDDGALRTDDGRGKAL